MIIALLTDFGTKDYFVGAMKGVIYSTNINATVIDITHEIEPQNIDSAGFVLRACYKNFPLKTIFVAVVDPGVGSDRRAVVVDTGEYFFIAPDNGLLSFAFEKRDALKVYEITNEKFFQHPVSRTFHGRDVFAPCAAHLSNGVSPAEFGAEISDYKISRAAANAAGSNDLRQARVIHIDRFGNLVTNISVRDLPDDFSLEINGRTLSVVRKFYSEAEKDEIFMIFGSAGYLEIAAFQNSAKKLLDAEIGDKIKVSGKI